MLRPYCHDADPTLAWLCADKGGAGRNGKGGGQLYPFSDLGSLNLPTSQGVGEVSTEMVPQT